MTDRAAIAARVTDVCESWEGTPYMRGQRMKGRAVDCANFVVAVLDELYGLSHDELVDIPPPAPGATHLRADAAIRQMMARFPHARLSGASAIEPGDVLFVRTDGGFGHVLIVGDRSLWHAARGGVCRTGVASVEGRIDRVFRTEEKERWITT